MNYIVWNLISDYDGYHETECATWEEAVACVRDACSYNKKAKAQFQKWLDGKIDEIKVMDKETGGRQSTTVRVFVTTKKLSGPQELE